MERLAIDRHLVLVSLMLEAAHGFKTLSIFQMLSKSAALPVIIARYFHTLPHSYAATIIVTPLGKSKMPPFLDGDY